MVLCHMALALVEGSPVNSSYDPIPLHVANGVAVLVYSLDAFLYW